MACDKNGGTVRLADVANVEDAVEDAHIVGLVQRQTAVFDHHFRQPGANIIVDGRQRPRVVAGASGIDFASDPLRAS